jgi:hypothetical protein
MKRATTLVVLVATVVLTLVGTSTVYGYASGVTGRTQKSGTSGCSCHSSTANSAVTVTIAGPATLTAGATGNYTVTVKNTGSFNSGVDIATSSGTLAAGTDAVLKVSSGEVVHQKNMTGSGSLVYNFRYTAPATTGTVTLYATGCGTSSSKPGWAFAPNFSVTVSAATDVKETGAKVNGYNLTQNYPNPFNPSTKISYSIAKDEYVTLNVYNVAGKEVARLVDGQRSAGEYSVSFNASELPSGVYFYKLSAGSFTQIKKMVLTK